MEKVDIPVLFITFARPEYARQSFDAIKKAEPSKLYFYSNKARLDHPEEIIKNNEIRSYINKIDWNCEIKTYFRDRHVDIYTSLWSALDWIFDNEEYAIVLEEDCVASLAFFDFCKQLLPKFIDDNRIWLISGNNLIEGFNPNNTDYIFSRYAYQYGWATWKQRWKQVIRGDIPVNEMNRYGLFKQLYISNPATKFQYLHAKRNFKSEAWDFKWGLTVKCNGGFGIVPKVNLVANIGVKGEHNKSRNKKLHHRPIFAKERYEISKHPLFVVPDYFYEKKFFKKIYRKILIRFIIKDLIFSIKKCFNIKKG